MEHLPLLTQIMLAAVLGFVVVMVLEYIHSRREHTLFSWSYCFVGALVGIVILMLIHWGGGRPPDKEFW